jgi:hypothetical protein
MTIGEVDSISFIDGGGSAQMMRYITKEHRVEYIRKIQRSTAGCIAFIARYSKAPQEPQNQAPQHEEEAKGEEPMKQEQPQIEIVEDWKDPEQQADEHVIRNRFAALLSVKSIITIFLTVIFGLLVLRGEELPDKFVSIYTMCISFFFGYQFKKAEGGK